jgi:hypothetical protein
VSASATTARKFFYVRNTKEVEEYVKCSRSVFYFIYTYLKLTHPVRGKLPFRLFPFQASLLSVYLKHPYSVTLKPRQMGISWLVAAYMLWLALFHPYKYILVVSIKQTVSRALLRRIKFMYLELPDFLKVEVVNGSGNQLGTADRLAFANGSEITVQASTDDAGRSDSLSLLVMDEAAFQRHASTTWGAAQQTLATGGQAIILSTAFGVGNFFHETYTDAIQGLNNFFPVRLTWQMHPERNEKWYTEQHRLLGGKRLAQEIDCNFLKSGFNVFDMAKIKEIEARLDEFGPPIQTKYGDMLKIYKKPEKGTAFVIGADVASGRSRDHSAFSIMDAYGNEYGCFKGKVSLSSYKDILMSTGKMFNYALLAPESNAIGEGLVSSLQDEGYDNLYRGVSKTMKLGDFERDESIIMGWFTTGKSRHEIITGMDDDMGNDLVQLMNPYFVAEAYTFIYNEQNKPIALGKTVGMKGSGAMFEDDTKAVYSDDAIFGACITNEIRKNPLRYYGAMPITAGR